ncbi:MAG: hypothetical protein VW378_04085 [bacterium]
MNKCVLDKSKLSYYSQIKLPPAIPDWTQLKPEGLHGGFEVRSIHQSGFNSFPVSLLKNFHLKHYDLGREIFMSLTDSLGIKVDLCSVEALQFVYRDYLLLHPGEYVQLVFTIAGVGKITLLLDNVFARFFLFSLLGGSTVDDLDAAFTLVERKVLQEGAHFFLPFFINAWEGVFSADHVVSDCRISTLSLDKQLSHRCAYIMFGYQLAFSSKIYGQFKIGYSAEVLRFLHEKSVKVEKDQLPSVRLSMETLNDVKVDCKGLFFDLDLPLSMFQSLSVGDVIHLNKSLNQLSRFCFTSSLSVPAQLGTTNGSYAMQLFSEDRAVSFKLAESVSPASTGGETVKSKGDEGRRTDRAAVDAAIQASEIEDGPGYADSAKVVSPRSVAAVDGMPMGLEDFGDMLDGSETTSRSVLAEADSPVEDDAVSAAVDEAGDGVPMGLEDFDHVYEDSDSHGDAHLTFDSLDTKNKEKPLDDMAPDDTVLSHVHDRVDPEGIKEGAEVPKADVDVQDISLDNVSSVIDEVDDDEFDDEFDWDDFEEETL